MKQLVAALFMTLALAAGTLASEQPQATAMKAGQRAPAFTLRDQNGKRVSLSEATGRKVVLVFYRGYW